MVTGEEAKLQEVESALANVDQIDEDNGSLTANIADNFLQEMKAVIEAKARNARTKFPQDKAHMVESTGLFVPKLNEMGLPPEVIEYMSKHNHQAIFKFAGADVLDAYSVTFSVVIDVAGNITSSLGVASGSLEAQGRCEQGFGWDACLVPTGSNQTYAEMGSNKRSTSSRAKAAAQVAKKLR